MDPAKHPHQGIGISPPTPQKMDDGDNHDWDVLKQPANNPINKGVEHGINGRAITAAHPVNNPANSVNEAASIGPSTALVIASDPQKLSICDRMGSEVVTLVVGRDYRRKTYTIHKNLLRECGGMYDALCQDIGPGYDTVMLNNEDPDALKLFINYIYSEEIPAIPHDAPVTFQATLLVILVRFYVFIEKYHLSATVRDKVMDNIQDGFYMIQKFPELILTEGVCLHSAPGSMMRKFCAASLVYFLRSEAFVQNGSIPAFFAKYNDFLVDFLDAFRAYIPHQDPRVRHCRYKENCMECVRAGGSDYLTRFDGVTPCRFHVHTGAKDAAGEPICHLWRPA
ncbi:uncharacterized protein L3040_008940 [Drepanopeziza brunnea f. sp. 'multigermtubi']|uniref:BTB domain-containing protein n=1 Tax=Marssonina brunnea f. sp. multigermtubi (strain MB_m1) TaxID=1072389 RepID=K1WW82_MARBU|nr:uncharacterized protein MBM_04873 [Drepanopeziza brunnea f. sp. 'multigermtubi' MB_m1]EKD17296.1 hypothetical protein MBM_04873 [Drepanopeziza brunnea f. sp. 'multigermtubi' MB_m1]KAJ5032333.1 hypothetical protein L3040_008940 [Drepanopeziza brunnea f. sp. 'multigermtubi']